MSEAAATWSLTAISLLAGLGALWVFGRFSNQEKIRHAKRRVRAHIYELTLFSGDPLLIWRAQKSLFAWNARYVGLMLLPAAILTVPMVFLLVQLDAVYGRRPLRVGEPAIVTAQVAPSVDLRTISPSLGAPPGIAVESPAVRLPSAHQVSWRIVPLRNVSGDLNIYVAGREFGKSFVAGAGRRYLSARRVDSRVDQIWYSGESLLPVNSVEWIEVEYPSTDVSVFGWRVHWLVWFFIVSMIGAFGLRKRMRVTF